MISMDISEAGLRLAQQRARKTVAASFNLVVMDLERSLAAALGI